MITRWEKIGFWIRFTLIQLLYGVIILLGLLIFPMAYFIRHVLKVEGKKNPLWWWLNYTKDNDWGLDHYKENPPNRNFWNAVKWYNRNPAWNFILLFPVENGEITDLEVETTVKNREYEMDWPDRDNSQWGSLKAYYRINRKVHGRYGFAKPTGLIKELQLGTSGDRYKLRMKF